MSELSACTSSLAPTFGHERNDEIVSQLPDSRFGDDSYDNLVAQLPSSLFQKGADDFEDCQEKRFVVTCELGTVIGHFVTSAKFLPPLLSGADAVVCVVVVFDAHGSLSGAALARHARDCYLLPYTGTSPASLREWLAELKAFLHYVAVDGFRARRFSVNVLQAEWRLQELACCDDALGDVLDVEYLASSFLGTNPASALEEACIMERTHGGSCFAKVTQVGQDRHWVQALLDCARCRSLKSMVSRALHTVGAPSTPSLFMQLRSHVADLAQRGARTGVLVDLNRLNILKRSAAAHRPRTPVLKTIKTNCDFVKAACASHEDTRYRWRLAYNMVSGAICSDLDDFSEFSTNLCSRQAVALPSMMASVHAPVPPFAAISFLANTRQDVTVLSILDNAQRVIIRSQNGDESECLSACIQVMQLVRGEHLSVRSALVSDYGSCFVSISVPMCPWIFLGAAPCASVLSAFDRSGSSHIKKPYCFDRCEAAACATSAISNLLAAALPELAAHKRCVCVRLALSPQRHDISTWASQLEIGLQEAEVLQSVAVAALSDILTGPPHLSNMPFHVVKPSLLGRRAPSADTFFDAALQHAWMSSADLTMLLARDCADCLRECLESQLNPLPIADAALVANDGHAACDDSPAASECYWLTALLPHTVIFSCRRNFLDAAMHALCSSAERLSKSINVDFPYRVAAGDNIGDLYSWNCPLLHMLPGLQQSKVAQKRHTRAAGSSKTKSKRTAIGSPNRDQD